MGDRIQYQLVSQRRDRLKSPILELGSKFYDAPVSFNYRSLFAGSEFVGSDMETGENVDVVCDLTRDFAEVDRALGGKRFNSILCASVFEHCDNPFKAAENIQKLLNPGGVLFFSVPFVFQIHGYPDDYWRFTPQGVKKLFPSLDFEKIPSSFSSGDHLSEEIHPLEDLPNYWLDFRTAKYKRERHYFRFLGACLVKLLGQLGLLHWLTKHRYAFPVITINMFGVKP